MTEKDGNKIITNINITNKTYEPTKKDRILYDWYKKDGNTITIRKNSKEQ